VLLKQEHRAFLAHVLLPLHRTRWVHKSWTSHTNCQKKVLLIEELNLTHAATPALCPELASPTLSHPMPSSPC
jgi:hypothetical protein